MIEHIGFYVAIMSLFWVPFCIWYNEDDWRKWRFLFEEWLIESFYKVLFEEEYFVYLERQREYAIGPYLRDKSVKKIMNKRARLAQRRRWAKRFKWEDKYSHEFKKKFIRNPNYTHKARDNFEKSLADPWDRNR